ncbi:MAG: 4-hydroxy-3-methylbut-2-enyl diphosphate reductase, partial [Clostridiales bacterium]|nr:4-hydroxy-3-methylbut-2-enyl diphosphate reductase [Candidatus Cacconaster stercorequi]
MKVIQAQSAGFCYGVERAVKLAEQTAREKGSCVMLGSIIHNANVVAELESLGARQIDGAETIRPEDTVLIRAHGEKKQVFDHLKKIGADCVDATCPNVLRVQQIVAQADAEGRTPVIIGEPHHPEVMGVASWSVRSVIFDGPAELEKWLADKPERRNLPITAVAQTTCIRSIWESSEEILKKECTNAKLFDTICNATHRRQSEAAELAAKVDVMVVVGDRKSANTKHLTEICAEKCPCVVQIERAEELPADILKGCRAAGLTAGASTPAGIIKEVYTTMSEEIKNTEAMEESFEEMLEKSFKTLNTGEKVTGIVTAIGPTEVQV